MFDMKDLEAYPPRNKDDFMRNLVGHIVECVYNDASDADKPVIKVIKNYREICDLLGNLTDYTKAAIESHDMTIARERASQVNAIMEPMIETLKNFIKYNM